jgi:hypothetical protein
MSADVGDVGTYGAADLENHGKEVAVLERVEYVGRTPGLLIIGPLVSRAGERPGGGIGLIREFPPPQLKGALHHLRGYRVRPFRTIDDDVRIVVGVGPRRPGKLSYRQLKVYYHVGGKGYVATYDEGVRVCTPRSLPVSSCRPPLGEGG